jgi:hypothetical protein
MTDCLLEVELHEFWPELRRAMVTTRKPHKCHWCEDDIPEGSKARVDVGITPHEGLWSPYTCLKCIKEIIEEVRNL